MKRAEPYDREAALDAATALFWRQGYDGVSLKDLERALKMKPGSIYAAFKSKETLFLLALERYFEAHRALLRSFGEGESQPLEALAGLLRRVGAGEDGDEMCGPCFLVKTLLESTSLSERISETVRAYLDEVEREIRALFDLAKGRGALDPAADTARLALKYLTFLTALRVETFRSTKPAALAMLAEDMATETEAGFGFGAPKDA